MRISAGSIQRKKSGIYHYIANKAGKTRSYSLKTADKAEAVRRARKLLVSPESEEAWLEYLAQLGRKAEAALRQRRLAGSLDWEGFAAEALLRTDGFEGSGESARQSHERWLAILSAEAPRTGDAGNDVKLMDFSRIHAEILARTLIKRYVSCRRMVDFYRKCWTAMGLDAAVWNLDGMLRRAMSERARTHDYYRRLTVREIAQCHAYLSKKHAMLADMVEIGYYTGLRLSDVAELDTSEIAPGGGALRIVPNKTCKTKPRALFIPLVHGAARMVGRLAAAAKKAGNGENPANGGTYLFAAAVRRRPSKAITAAFRACSIAKAGRARASFHSLRATFISMMDEAGIPPHITDSVTGHGGGGMHARYSQPAPDAVRRAIEKAIKPLKVSDIVSGPR